jgi:predicted nucleotidyltransferase
MYGMESLMPTLRSRSEDLCRQYRLARLGLFGSVARGEDSPESDLDVFAEFKAPDPHDMPARYFGLQAELEELCGRRVQIVTPGMIRNPYFRRSLERDLVTLHE